MSFAALAVVACASSGCLVVSLEPIYTPATIQTDDPLLGFWEDTEDRSTAVVERGEWKSYRVTYTNGSTSLDLTAYETTIGDWTFLDLTPTRGLESGPLDDPGAPVGSLHQDRRQSASSPASATTGSPRVAARTLGQLDTAFDSRKNMVLVSGTDAMRAWILSHVAVTDAFGEPVSFTRRK